MTEKKLPAIELAEKDVIENHASPSILAERIREIVNPLVFDVSTSKGRSECKSTAAQIIRCITVAHNVSKSLAADAKEVIAKDLSFRKEIEAELRKISEEVRKPLTHWEDEQSYLSDWELAIAENEAFDLRKEQERIDAKKKYLSDWELAIAENEIFDLRKEKEAKEALERAEQEKREQEERERVAEEQRKEREAQAVAKALKDQQDKQEQERIEAEKKAQEAIEKAEREKIAAEQRAEQAAKEERERIEREQKEKQRIEEERARNVEHRRKINNEIVCLLVENGFSEIDAKKVVQLSASGMLGNLVVSY